VAFFSCDYFYKNWKRLLNVAMFFNFFLALGKWFVIVQKLDTVNFVAKSTRAVTNRRGFYPLIRALYHVIAYIFIHINNLY